MSAKKLLYLSDSRLSAWLWQSGKLTHIGDFNADPEGLAGFDDYLAKSPNTPIHLLVDLIEEDFRNETIPHLLGKNRQALISRKLNQLFRANTYRHASLQGREEGGKREDKLLLTGLTHEELLKPWVECITRAKRPLVGVYSLPLLTQVLAKKLELSAPHQLIITRQGSSGLRQSYFQENQIKFSRLTLLSAEDMDSIQGTVSREALRTQQYLNSLRLLPRDRPLDIAVCGGRHLLQLQAESISTPLLRYQILTLEDIFGRLGFKISNLDLTSEQLYLHLLGRFPPPQHYAPPAQLWYNQLRLVRTGIFGVAAVIIAIGAYVTGINLSVAFDDNSQSEKLARETGNLNTQYQAIKSTFPPTPATPENMKSAVELVEAAARRNVEPEPLLAIVSRALEVSPTIKLNQIKWSVSDKPDEENPPGPQPPPTQPTSPAPMAGGSATHAITVGMGKPYQVVVLDGEINPTNYRSALDSFERFVEALKKNPSLQVTLLDKPIDTSSTTSQKGNADREGPEKAVFSVKLTLVPTP
ncbi:MAG: hypothetical protein WC091_10485 [Sulfuricellaceae bacterium]